MEDREWKYREKGAAAATETELERDGLRARSDFILETLNIRVF